jgi:hypothetical protein
MEKLTVLSQDIEEIYINSDKIISKIDSIMQKFELAVIFCAIKLDIFLW